MVKTLDFSKAKKPTLPIRFDDGTMIHVYTPTKAEFEEMTEAKEYFDAAINDDVENTQKLYEITARLMSNNKTGRVITGEELAGHIDVGDIIVFFRCYSEFIAEVINVKN